MLRLVESNRSFLRKRQTAGFSLTEIVVVIAIIAVLVAIMFPVFGAARNSTSLSKCVAHLRAMGAALGVYSAEHQGDWPYVGDYTEAVSSMPVTGPYWTYDNIYNTTIGWQGVGALYKTGGLSPETMFCPNDKDRREVLEMPVDWESPAHGLISSYSMRGTRQIYSPTLKYERFGRKLADVTGRAIVSCHFRYNPLNPKRHPLSMHAGYKIPVLYGDGHVEVKGLPPNIRPENPPTIDDNLYLMAMYWTHFDNNKE